MIDRIFKNKKTTLLGLGLIIVGVALVWFEKATLTEVSMFFATGLLSLFAKDPKPKVDE